MINPQIILPNGDDFELDIISVVNGRAFWIEAKSGDYQQHVRKYSKLAQLMGLDKDHAIMMLADISTDRCAALSSLFNMTVVSLDTFSPHVQRVIDADAKQIAEKALLSE